MLLMHTFVVLLNVSSHFLGRKQRLNICFKQEKSILIALQFTDCTYYMIKYENFVVLLKITEK